MTLLRVLILLFCVACGKTQSFQTAEEMTTSNVVGGTSAYGGVYDSVFNVNGCTAVAISPHLLITAAHCVHYDVVSTAEMRVNLNNSSGTSDWSFKMDAVHIHPDYPGKIAADLAVVELHTDLTENFNISEFPAIAQLTQEELYNLRPEDKLLTAVGYGQKRAKDIKGKFEPRISKSRVDLDLINFYEDFYIKKEKEWAFRTINEEFLLKTYPTTFSLRSKGKDTCKGDSGGPVFINWQGKQQLFGITIRGADNCGEGKLPSYYRMTGKEICLFKDVLKKHNIELNSVCELK